MSGGQGYYLNFAHFNKGGNDKLNDEPDAHTT